MSDLSRLEREVLEKLLDGDDLVLASLRKQLDSIDVADREMSGVGFFTTFLVSQTSQTNPAVTGKTFKIGGVYADILGLEHGAGFVLYVQDGLLKMLEAYTYDEQWPVDANNFKLSYIGGERDLEKLRSRWSDVNEE